MIRVERLLKIGRRQVSGGRADWHSHSDFLLGLVVVEVSVVFVLHKYIINGLVYYKFTPNYSMPMPVANNGTPTVKSQAIRHQAVTASKSGYNLVLS